MFSLFILFGDERVQGWVLFEDFTPQRSNKNISLKI